MALKSFSNMLSSAQEERLALFTEESGECLQIIGKVGRHGWKPTDFSVDPPKYYDNKADLEKETGQLMHAIKLMCLAGDLDREEIQRHFDEREQNIKKYLHHQ